METVAMESMFTTLLTSNPWLAIQIDWLLKSIVIIFTVYIIIQSGSRWLSSSSKHLLWLSSLGCVVLLPLTLVSFSPGDSVTSPASKLITIEVGSITESGILLDTPQGSPAGLLLLSLYLLPTSILLLRLAISIIRALRIGKSARLASRSTTLTCLNALRDRMQVSRQIELKYSDEISSPMSFGLIRPQILLPAAASNWNDALLNDVLVHELSHIKRFDWSSLFFAYVVTSLLWINPLVWLALRNLSIEAENSCDSSVLRHGQSDASYAENLLSIARDFRDSKNPRVLAQPILGKSLLAIRIKRILGKGNVAATSHRFFAIPLSLLMAAILLTCSNTELLGTETASRPPPARSSNRDGDILPVTAEAPQYPVTAAFNGIEGWALLEFTVNVDGSVAEETISVADAEPPNLFNRASIRAVTKFKFAQLDGANAQAIDGVQYLFRYRLEETAGNEVVRDYLPIDEVVAAYPQSLKDQNISGSVWTVFTVTREGSVQDVEVRYSSDEALNEYAIEAANQLRYRPRRENGRAVDVPRVQYLFRFSP